MKKPKIIFTTLLIVLLIGTLSIQAQYFGQNKVNYEMFDFSVLRTDHFQIYNYLENNEVLEDFASLSERWYLRHQAVFLDTITGYNPVILYNNHAEFQQTTVIQSLIGPGTGGVTEGLRNRVVMPVMASNAEINHVLGHELVHVFQYNMFRGSDSVSFQAINSIPLWMIEGLAEYLSIGRYDAQTTMWMRDAVMQDDIPTIKDMTRKANEYFPYRYGHAFWAYITGLWGDGVIRPLVLLSGKVGHERAIDSLLNYSADSISTLWKNSLTEYYQPYIDNGQEPVGKKMFGPRAGKMKIAPSLSPDGKYMVFLSDKNVVTIDFYLADVEKRRIVKRLTQAVRNTHIDNYSYTESAGTWAPDSRKYAITTFSEGRNKLMIFDVNRRRTLETIDIEGLDFFNNPAWSPDGNSIVLAGLAKGQSDLYMYDIENGTVRQLTDDRYSDLQPAWSPDGSKIVFISDRGSETDFDAIKYGTYKINIYDVGSGSVKSFDFFPGSNNTSPQFSIDGKSVYFLSIANGTQNIYELELDTENLYRLSDFKTGVSGITELSPALAMAREQNVMAYILYEDDGYSIYKARPEDFKRERVDAAYANLQARELPPGSRRLSTNVVEQNLDRYPKPDPSVFSTQAYRPEFSLEYVGNAGVGVGFSQIGTSMAGGVSFLFSDMLKRNQLYTSVNVQGEIYDIGGQAVYMNNTRRLGWGTSVSHIPYRSTRAYMSYDTTEENYLEQNLTYLIQRTFVDELSFFGNYPLSKKLRFEGGASASVYSYRMDSINTRYINGIEIDRTRGRIDEGVPPPFMVYRGYLAFVGDDASFGLTSPLQGYRYRFQAGRTFGKYSYWGLTADYRKYFFFKPLGFAFRAIHYGRYGKDANSLYPMYLGNHYYVRGYSYNSLRRNRCIDNDCLRMNQLTGSKMVLAGAEVRFPFTGPKRLAVIKSGFLFSDLVLFGDGGLMWEEHEDIKLAWDPYEDKHTPIFSVGLAYRVNLFGYVILEPYYAIPLQRDDVDFGVLGFHLSAGGW